jgi:bifunctional DNA-binding transcriptional regulator/antitoxin component of YhaV-PrlF toxin-antitoxin module
MIMTKISSQYTLKIPTEFRSALPAGEEVTITVDMQGRLIVTPVEKIRTLLMETFGMWADRTDIPSDGVTYVDEIRKGRRLDDFGLHQDETD